MKNIMEYKGYIGSVEFLKNISFSSGKSLVFVP